MKAESLNCPNCQSPLTVEPGETIAKCEYCGSTVSIDDGAVKVEVRLTDQEEAGYQFEKGRQRAQIEQQAEQFQSASVQMEKPKKRKTWLWVLGWMFVFPVPLTILMLNSPRTENLDKRLRIAIVAAGWIFYLIIGLSGSK